METRALGKDGPQVSIICFGAWPIAGAVGAVPREQAVAAVRAALDAGMTFIDTAESYLDSEDIVGEAIEGRRHQVFLATKLSHDHSSEGMARAMENSLRALRTDYVDLYQLHSWKPQWPIAQTMEGLLRLRDAGKIRYIGVSNFSPEQTRETLKHGLVHSSQPRYNLLFRDEEPVLNFCLEHGVGVMPYEPLATGLLTGKYRPGHRFAADDWRHDKSRFQGEESRRAFEVTERLKMWAADHGRDMVQLAIAWVLARPAVTSAIVGAKSPEQVYHNAKAADWRLTDRELAEIEKMVGGLRLHGEW